jgi:hypothetical protein
LRKKADYTGRIYGACKIIGPAEESGMWIVECCNCGTRTVRTRSAIRGLRANAQSHRGCWACKHEYTRRRVAVGMRPTAAYNPEHAHDIGVRWLNGAGFISTEIGSLQQRFYLGRFARGAQSQE